MVSITTLHYLISHNNSPHPTIHNDSITYLSQNSHPILPLHLQYSNSPHFLPTSTPTTPYSHKKTPTQYLHSHLQIRTHSPFINIFHSSLCLLSLGTYFLPTHIHTYTTEFASKHTHTVFTPTLTNSHIYVLTPPFRNLFHSSLYLLSLGT